MCEMQKPWSGELRKVYTKLKFNCGPFKETFKKLDHITQITIILRIPRQNRQNLQINFSIIFLDSIYYFLFFSLSLTATRENHRSIALPS